MKRVTRLDVDRAPDDADRDDVLRDRPCPSASAACRFFAAADVSCAALGATTTLLLPCGVPVNDERREPRVLRQRAADLVDDVRPDEAVFVEALDDVDLAEQRSRARFGAVALLEEVRIARRVAKRVVAALVELASRRGLRACTARRRRAAATTSAAIAPIRNLSRRRPVTPAAIAPRSTAWRCAAFLLACAWQEIDFDHGRGVGATLRPGGSGDLPERQTDGQHQQRSDLVGDERFERAVTHFQVRERVGLLHRDAQARRRACR